VIGLSQTGSGKTGAFVLPILHAFLEAPQPHLNNFFACIMSPTRFDTQTPDHVYNIHINKFRFILRNYSHRYLISIFLLFQPFS
jgi:ATP-dependent helicase YprA (DUF1998 family)